MNQKKLISEERTSRIAFPELAAFWNQDILCLCLWYLQHFAPENLLFLGIGRIFGPWIFHLLRICNISNLESWLYQLQHFGACSKSNLLSPRYMQHSEKNARRPLSMVVTPYETQPVSCWNVGHKKRLSTGCVKLKAGICETFWHLNLSYCDVVMDCWLVAVQGWSKKMLGRAGCGTHGVEPHVFFSLRWLLEAGISGTFCH